MKISVQSQEKSTNIILPSWLLFNDLSATMFAVMSRGKKKTEPLNMQGFSIGGNISAKDMRRICREIRRLRRELKDWYLVEAESKGEKVKIRL